MNGSAAPGAAHRSRFPLWVVLVAGGTITSISLGVRSTFGILLEPIADGLGTQTGSIAIAIAVQNLLWGLSQPIAGAASDRFGAAPTLAAGGLLYMLSLILMTALLVSKVKNLRLSPPVGSRSGFVSPILDFF